MFVHEWKTISKSCYHVVLVPSVHLDCDKLEGLFSLFSTQRNSIDKSVQGDVSNLQHEFPTQSVSRLYGYLDAKILQTTAPSLGVRCRGHCSY